jgi:hypothetical protein
MTTYLPFSPTYRPGSPPWTSTLTLDGNGYTLTVRWLLYSQRWYIELAALDGTVVFFKPMVGSPPLTPLVDLTWETGSPAVSGSVEAGITGSVATGSIVIPLPPTSQTGQAIGSAAEPLAIGVGVGAIIEFTITGATPDGYDGTFECVVLDDFSFSYPLVTNPGTPASIPGYYSSDINLVEGYFLQSTLVWRETAGWFEVNP